MLRQIIGLLLPPAVTDLSGPEAALAGFDATPPAITSDRREDASCAESGLCLA